MDERYKYVLKLLKAHKNLLETIANVLKEKETIEGKEFLELVKTVKEAKVAAEKEPSEKKAGAKKLPAEKKIKAAPKKTKKVSE